MTARQFAGPLAAEARAFTAAAFLIGAGNLRCGGRNTRTILQTDDPDHLGLRCNACPRCQTAMFTPGVLCSYFSYANWATDCWTLPGTRWWPEYDRKLGVSTKSRARKPVANRAM